MIIVGVDIGGTFTDFVSFDGKKLNRTKILPTPHKPGKAVFEGLRLLEISGKKMTIVHGSTVATNAFLEKKGAKFALITTNSNLFLG